MLRFIDGGGDHYSTAEINAKWSSSSGVIVSTGTGRFGGNSLRLADHAAGSFLSRTLDPQPTWVVGAGFQLPGFPAASAPIIRLLDQGVSQVELRVNADGTLSVTRNGTAVAGGTSTLSLKAGHYYFIELKVTLGDAVAANTCKARVNGDDVLTVAAGQDLQNTANATANSVSFHGTVANTHLDDVYIADGTGTANNDLLGDCRVVTVLPNAAGDKSEMALTGVDLTGHYQAVNSNPPDITSYVSSMTPGQTDLYHFADVTLTGTVRGVQVSLYARKDDAGPRQMAHAVKSGGVEYVGPTFSPGTGYLFRSDVRETDPDTGLAWTVVGLNTLQVGVRLIA